MPSASGISHTRNTFNCGGATRSIWVNGGEMMVTDVGWVREYEVGPITNLRDRQLGEVSLSHP